MDLFAIGVGGTGAKCLEALTHLQACGLLQAADGRPVRLGTFLVDPDQQSALLTRAQTAITRYGAMRRAVGSGTEAFCRGPLEDYGHWSPLSTASGALSLEQVFPKAVLNNRASGLAALFDCLFPPEEQQADLEVGFRGRPPIGSAVMSRISLEQEAQTGEWQKMLSAIESAAGSGDPPVIHLFGSVFGGTGASGVPTLGQLLKNWLKRQNLQSVRVHASLLLPYFDFDGQGDGDTGIHAEVRNFQLNTDAALQYLRSNGDACFDSVYLLGSDVKARFDFSIGGTTQANAAHVLELLAALACRSTISRNQPAGYAFSISRSNRDALNWEDLPEHEVVGKGLAAGARFAVAWLNNFSKEIEAAQKVRMTTFVSGAPWARRFFSTSGKAAAVRGERPAIRDSQELSTRDAIDAYCEALLQWLAQVSGNTGSGFEQNLFTTDTLAPTSRPINALGRVVLGKARPNVARSADTVERIKIRMDRLSRNRIKLKGVAGLADTLWQLSI